MEKSIRQTIQEVSDELSKNIDLIEPVVASRKLVELSNLYTHLNRQLAGADYAYRLRLGLERSGKSSVADARLIAETSEEYKLLVEMKNERESLIELIRSLKLFIRANREEYEANRNL